MRMRAVAYALGTPYNIIYLYNVMHNYVLYNIHVYLGRYNVRDRIALVSDVILFRISHLPRARLCFTPQFNFQRRGPSCSKARGGKRRIERVPRGVHPF